MAAIRSGDKQQIYAPLAVQLGLPRFLSGATSRASRVSRVIKVDCGNDLWTWPCGESVFDHEILGSLEG